MARSCNRSQMRSGRSPQEGRRFSSRCIHSQQIDGSRVSNHHRTETAEAESERPISLTLAAKHATRSAPPAPPATPNSSSARDHTIDAGAPAACAAPRAPGSSPSGPQASCLRYPVTPARRPSPHLPRPPSPWRRLPCLRSPPQQHRRPPAFCRSAGRRHTMLRRSRPEPRRAWSLRWNNTGAPPLAGTPAACIFQHTPPPS